METGILDPGAGSEASILTTLEGVHILEELDKEKEKNNIVKD
jgi:hypothetical protein